MAGERREVDQNSAVYKEFTRLYRIAREMRPSSIDKWNGKLFAIDDGPWGSFDPKTGNISLSQELVLDHLTGSTTQPPSMAQAQAIATVYHEAEHARVDGNAPHELNAMHHPNTLTLNEGLTERRTVNDFPVFAELSGYHGLGLGQHQYEGAVEAVDRLVAHAATEDRQNQLVREALDQPVAMQWDPIANEIVRNQLGDVVPQNPRHRQAARAELIRAMSAPPWAGIQHRPQRSGVLIGEDAQRGLNAAVGRIREHYAQHPGTPYPSTPPNAAAAAALDVPRERMFSDFSPSENSHLAAGSRGQATAIAEPAMRAAFAGQAPAAGATQRAPNLGNGARGSGRGTSPGLEPRGRDDR
jgi:hypothetical protein